MHRELMIIMISNVGRGDSVGGFHSTDHYVSTSGNCMIFVAFLDTRWEEVGLAVSIDPN